MKKAEERTHGAFPGVLSAGRKRFGALRFCFLHIKQIAASGVRHDHVRGLPVKKRREDNAVESRDHLLAAPLD